MTLRKVFFWLHLATGIVAGLVVLNMAATGVLLAFEKQITGWADGSHRVAPPSPEAPRLSLRMQVEKVREARPDAAVTTVTVRAESGAPTVLGLGRDGTLFVDPYTGRVLGEGSRGARSFFRIVTDWHRWLGTEGPNRPLGKAVTGASNLAFLFLVTSGFYLWWPRSWSRRAVQGVTLFQAGLTGKARDFNWHNVIGFWSATPLFFVVLTAVFMSYTWANDLLYRVTGNEPPTTRQAGPGGPPAGGERREGAARRPEGERRGGGMGRPMVLDGLDSGRLRAEQQVPGWRSITLRLPGSGEAPLVATIDEGNGGRPDLRSTLTLDAKTGEVAKYETFAGQNLGRRLRTWARFVHTGEALGLVGQGVAGAASAGATVLVWTGFALAWRRLRAWLARRAARTERQPVAALSETQSQGGLS
jgi:uncharacterized iron-regulated membrane protein